MAKHGVTQFLTAFEDDTATFFELIPDLLVVVENDGTIRRVNCAFEQAVGHSRYEVYGKAFYPFVLADDLVTFISAFTSWPPAPPFRLLHRGHGVVTCRLILWQIRRGRSFIIMRRVGDER